MFGISIEHLIQSGGILLVAFIVFAESGLLVGFFLPGDSLLFSAGLLASRGHMNLFLLLIAVVIAAVIGDNVGYQIGRRTGKRIFRRKDSFFFHQDHIDRAERFYNAHGGKTIIMARFVPVVRTFAPLVAGIGKMPYRRFITYNIIGAVLWGAGVIMLGVWLGEKIPNIDKFILPVIAVIMAGSFAMAFVHLLREAGNRERMIRNVKHWLNPRRRYAAAKKDPEETEA